MFTVETVAYTIQKHSSIFSKNRNRVKKDGPAQSPRAGIPGMIFFSELRIVLDSGRRWDNGEAFFASIRIHQERRTG